ncbi:MAG: hypothetical protein LQ340_006507 [Diploschistes diacapsis]|nr:MAG: hypothetical protein LQ340_006507 [Diploschistes diacapsis]
MAHASLNAREPKNIYIIGSQSSGKTTLISALVTYFTNKSNLTWKGLAIKKPQILQEVARQVLQDHNSTGKDVSESKTRALELQTLILQAQYKAENAAKSSWFISDRSGVDAIIYCKCYAGETGTKKLVNTKEWKELEITLRDSLIIVCEPVKSWLEEDGLRFMPKDALAKIELVSAIHQLFCDFLDQANFRYSVLPNTLCELIGRLNFVIGKWRETEKDLAVQD